jgi:NAD(P)-dependent dehydrogenase (short-subunit alcohol dehydrogenase family)
MRTTTIHTRKIAIVTGGSRGIGRNTVESLARRGVNTIFTFNTHRADADAVVAAVEASGANAVAVQLDSGNIASFDAFVENVTNALTRLETARFDFLVNNAGNSHRNMPFEKATVEELDSIYNVHFKGIFFLTQKLLPFDERWRTYRQRVDRPDTGHFAGRFSLRVDERRS